MQIVKQLNDLKKEHTGVVEKLEGLIKETEGSIELVEKEKLQAKVAALEKDIEELRIRNERLASENLDIKNALNQQIIDEKLGILKLSEEKLELYFGTVKTACSNGLKQQEIHIKEEINKMKKIAGEELEVDRKEFLLKVSQLSRELDEKVKQAREKHRSETDSLWKDFKSGLHLFSQERVTDATVTKRIKQNKLEMNIGLRGLSGLGIVLILIAVGFFAYWFRGSINNYMRGGAIFLLGILFLGAGEVLYRREKNIFAKVLLGGGIAILYSAIFFCHFVLLEEGEPIMDFNLALILSIIVTITTILLSLRYNSKEVISFGLVGGFLPFISYMAIGFEGNAYYMGMGYLSILNLAVLIISFLKKWRIPGFISFFLHIPALIFLSFNGPSETAGVVYTSVTFAIYLVVILAYPFIYKKKLKKPDIILLSINTFISCLIIYTLFLNMNLSSLWGVLALGFSVIYGLLGYLVSRIMKEEKESMTLFYLTSLTFAILMVPFQLKTTWYTLGWIIEGLLLIIAGNKKRIKALEKGGWFITALCVAAFFWYDLVFLSFLMETSVHLFDLKYTLVTFSIILVFLFYQREILKNRISEFSARGNRIKVIKYFGITNFYFYTLYMAGKYYRQLIDSSTGLKAALGEPLVIFYELLLMALITLGLAITLGKWKFLHDKIIKTFSDILQMVSIIFCMVLVGFIPLIEHSFTGFSRNRPIEYFSIFLLLAYNGAVLYYLRESILRIISKKEKSLEYYPLSMAVILMANITAFMVLKLNLEDISIILSFVYLLLALGFIAYGFIKKYLFIRYFGLGVIFLSVLILFINIFSFTNIPGRIASFLGSGLLLLGISFIYQLINKRLKNPSVKHESPGESGNGKRTEQ